VPIPFMGRFWAGSWAANQNRRRFGFLLKPGFSFSNIV